MQAPALFQSFSLCFSLSADLRNRVRPVWLLAAVAALAFPGCAAKKPKYETVDYEAAKLATPPHKMKRHEYPFDDWGRYRKDWVKKGASSQSAEAVNPPRNIPTDPGTYASNSPKPTPTAPPPPPKPKARYHTVKKGDTLYGIGRKYGVTISKIKSTNGLRSDLIRIGQTLRIPG